MRHVWQKPTTAYQHKRLVPTVKHSGEGDDLDFFAATGPEQSLGSWDPLYTNVL